jgi:hypothetical protein
MRLGEFFTLRTRASGTVSVANHVLVATFPNFHSDLPLALIWQMEKPCRCCRAFPNVLGVESYSCILLATRNGNQQESNIVPVAAVTKVSA